MDNIHILIGILLLVIIYLLFNKKENYDDVPVPPPLDQAPQMSSPSLLQQSPQMSSPSLLQQSQVVLAIDSTLKDKILNNIKMNNDTIKYLDIMLQNKLPPDTVESVNKQRTQLITDLDMLNNQLNMLTSNN
jgi:hypothetical protein